MTKIALITGITGQDGYYLSRLMLSKGYRVVGLVPPDRQSSVVKLAKLHAHWTMVHHRDRYGLFACSGILFNHESPRRPPQFVTRKISLAAAAIKLGVRNRLSIGNLDAKRDWGFAGDHVEAMWRMLQADTAEDYVIGTGMLHTVRDLVAAAFDCVGLDWQRYVETDLGLVREDEHFQLVANPAKAKQNLDWEPQVSFEQLVAKMVQADLMRLKAGSITPVGAE